MAARQLTQKEVQARFLEHLWENVRYWERVEDVPLPHNDFKPQKKTVRDRLEGLAFSILVMLDGCSGDMPSFEVYPAPHHESKEDDIEHEKDWWPPEEEAVSVHGEDMLHDLWYEYGRAHGYVPKL